MRALVRPVAVLLTLGLAVLAGCSNDSGSGSRPGGGPAASAEEGAFPVTIKHKYGSTELTAAPSRVVAVGLVEQDPLLALGVVPVATTEWFGEKPGALFPWAKAKLGDAAVPQVLSDKDGIQFEKIAALDPDLIIGLYAGMKAEDYKKLSEIAPTVAQPPGVPDYGVSWQVVARTVGQAVGRPKAADDLVKGIEARFAEVRAANPEFKGKVGILATPYEGYFVYGSQDPRSRLLTDLGFTLPAGLDQAIGDKFGANISAEKLSLLDQQVLVWFPQKGGTAKLKADPLYKNLTVRKQGRDIFVEENFDDDLYGATSFVSVLSLPIVIDQLVPKLKTALDGNPTTNA